MSFQLSSGNDPEIVGGVLNGDFHSNHDRILRIIDKAGIDVISLGYDISPQLPLGGDEPDGGAGP